MLKYIFVFTLFATLATCCCLPRQFSSILGYSSFSGHLQTSHFYADARRVYFDLCNNRVRYENFKHRTVVIVDYKNSVMHSVVNGTKCHSFTVRGNLTRYCVPKTLTFLTSGSFGAGRHRLGFNIFHNRRTYANTTTANSFVTSSRGCIAITNGGYSAYPKGGSVYGFAWVNFTVGVSDLGVFKPPPSCKGNRSLRTVDFDLTDHIATDFAKEAKDGEKAYREMMDNYVNPKPAMPNLPVEKTEDEKEKFDEKKFLRENFGLGAFDL